MVLGIEQEMLRAQAHRAAIIVAKSGEIQDYATYLAAMGEGGPDAGPMLNVYPDSIGGTLAGCRRVPAPPGGWPARSPRRTCCRASSTPTSIAASP